MLHPQWTEQELAMELESPSCPCPGPSGLPNRDILMYEKTSNKGIYLVILNTQPDVICMRHLVASLTQNCAAACYCVFKGKL